ncbi:structural protein [Tatumella sp. UBA2305]|uniref:structural protein n=1 Tax=Tatumella sp. UBA2305 TaxID=1947647 RepID=UPI0025F5008E|nr:structural protein [Tatumella sp. UBA2305]
MRKISRGIRNNNPGNIRWGDEWLGLVQPSERTDTEFCQFISPQYGIRAMIVILRNYQIKYGLNTLFSIINRWAPPDENNTDDYIDNISGIIGVDKFYILDLSRNQMVIAIIKAIIFHENGSQPYTKDIFYEVLGML